MLWNCNNGLSQILTAGGSITTNINLGICSPPSVSLIASNITGIPFTGFGYAQDIADIIIDPVSNEMYTIFCSASGTPSIDNKLFKHTPPYIPANIAWNVPSGYFTFAEGLTGHI